MFSSCFLYRYNTSYGIEQGQWNRPKRVMKVSDMKLYKTDTLKTIILDNFHCVVTSQLTNISDCSIRVVD